MKRKPALLATTLVLLLAAPVLSQNASSAERVLRQVADKLGSAKLLGYKYKFEYSYPSQGRNIEEKGDVFFDLRPDNSTEQFRYQFVSDARLSVYNGSELFIADGKSKKLYVENSPSFKSVGNILLQNSPLSMKYALPALIANKAIVKKVTSVKSAGRENFSIEFSLPKAVINSIGEIQDIRGDQTVNYRLTVDGKTFLPVEAIQTNDKNDEVLKTTYAEITEKPPVPSESSWYFSTYQSGYKLEKKEKRTLIAPGAESSNFSLALYGADSHVSLEKYKGKVVLIEFWIAHCGFCIAAVPKLNELSRNFESRGLEIVSVNMYDPAATIEFFKKKNGPQFAILTGGDSIAAAYGVDSFPAFVLVGNSGKVVYSSSGLQASELESAIVANIQQ